MSYRFTNFADRFISGEYDRALEENLFSREPNDAAV